MILAGVLFSDLGRRAITRSRLVRPLLIAAGAGALFLAAVATSGAGLTIEIAGTATGILLGLFAGSLMRIERSDVDGTVDTRTGAAYAVVWIVVIGARLAFIDGTSHWFNASLASWMHTNQITANALTDALILMALAMTVARTLSLLARARMSAPAGDPRLVGSDA